jgi:hypothetical protein
MIGVLRKELGLATCRRWTHGRGRTEENKGGESTNMRENAVCIKG